MKMYNSEAQLKDCTGHLLASVFYFSFYSCRDSEVPLPYFNRL